MTRMTRTPFLRAVALFGALLLPALPWAAPARAQTADATVEIDVADETGAALPGVSVELKRAETGFSRTSVSSIKGSVRFPAVPAASGYSAKVALQGFEPVEQALTLRIGQTARLKFVLRAKAIAESVTVIGEAPMVDVYKIDSSTNIIPEQIKALPVANREFEKLAFIAPGVQRERGEFRFVTGGPVIGSGGNASQSTILVDGVDYTDPALGLAKTRVSQDAIAEFRVINSRFDAEVGGSAGGALTVLTKTGTNEIKGSLFAYYRDASMRAKGALEKDSSVDFRRGQYGVSLGGPIVKDRTHFFLSGEYVDEVKPTLFRPQGAFVSQAADLEVPTKQILAFGSVTHSLTDGQTLLLKADYEKYRLDNFRVGGVQSQAYGQELQRDNYNFTGGYTAVLGAATTNELRAQYGSRKYFEPTNSNAVADWFSNGVTLKDGGNILGDLLGEGDQFEIRDTLYFHLTGTSGTHDVKAGAGWQHVKDRSIIDTYATGLFLWANDFKAPSPYAFPIAYAYGVGSSDVTVKTNRIAGFLQDDWRPMSNLTVSVGIRYDLDTNGNNTGFTHPLIPEARKRDTNNFQPRIGLSWDVAKNGQFVARGGWGLFVGRNLLVPSFTELQQNGVTGRKLYTRVNGLLYGIPALALDPNNPMTTGIALPIDITLLDQTLDAPEASQFSAGLTSKLWQTGLFLDVEGIWVKGTKELIVADANWSGNATHIRPNKSYNQINVYSNEGESEYKALTLSLNGNLKGGHLVMGSVTFASKYNRNDDFSPEFPTGYPSDPADLANEYGRARSAERMRFVISGVFRLPWQLTLAPIFNYGTGQPWTRRYGYDYNGDGKASDRMPGVDRFGVDGPLYRSFDLRLAKAFTLGSAGNLELIVEGFNLFNSTNYDVSSIDGAEFLSGPTITNPAAVARTNPNFGKPSATLPSREIQVGVRFAF
ncbi:MAG TPA: TonB-dependent receptor [Thermoanaerobaculia bacterium]|nr:TonB-dependent receptor [Thermoanaerobaculia bacterium]